MFRHVDDGRHLRKSKWMKTWDLSSRRVTGANVITVESSPETVLHFEKISSCTPRA